MECTELIKSVSIENLLQRRADVLECFVQIRALAKKSRQLSAMFADRYPPDFEWASGGQHHDLVSHYKEDNLEEQLAEYTRHVDKIAWSYLMKESGNLALMDSKAKHDWEQSLTDFKFPELTLENIRATFQDMHMARGEMFDRGVLNVYNSLSRHYKANDPFGFKKKIIVGYLESHYSGGCTAIDDLVRCFHVFDNKPEPEYSQCTRNLMSAAKRAGQDFLETEYIHLKWYQNGNGHVTLLRPDLVEKLNRTLFRHFPAHLAHDQYEAAKRAA